MGSMGNEMVEETLNMQQVTMREFTDFVKDAIEMENFNTPILCLGKSGIGKTESLRNEVAEPLKIGLIELRLASYSETDLVGVPYFVDGKSTGKKITQFADMGILPHLASTGEGDDPDVGILLLDELPAASKSVRTVALQLMDASRSIGDYKLPPKWLIVALGNGPTDGGMFNGLEYALISRASCLRVNPDFQTWKRWAIKNNVHPSVISFIQNNGGTSMLHKIKSMDMGGYEEKECNPRSWVGLSRCITKKENLLGKMLTSRQVEIYSGASVGANLAVEFSTFYKFKADMVPIEDIISGQALSIDISNIKMETLYMSEPALVGAMNDILNENMEQIDNYELPKPSELKKIQNIIKWIIKIDSVKTDLAIEAFKDINQANELFECLILMDEFDDFVPEYSEYSAKRGNLTSIMRAARNA